MGIKAFCIQDEYDDRGLLQDAGRVDGAGDKLVVTGKNAVTFPGLGDAFLQAADHISPFRPADDHKFPGLLVLFRRGPDTCLQNVVQCFFRDRLPDEMTDASSFVNGVDHLSFSLFLFLFLRKQYFLIINNKKIERKRNLIIYAKLARMDEGSGKEAESYELRGSI